MPCGARSKEAVTRSRVSPFFFGPAVAGWISGCGIRPPGGSDQEAFRGAVAEFYRGVETGNAEQIIRLFAEDAIVMPDGYAPIRGKEEIAATWRRETAGGFRIRDLVVLEESIDESVAYRLNSYAWTMLSEGPEAEWRQTKNVHVWRKQRDGSWKLQVDLWNESPRNE